jgi:hypothetical protein
VIERQKRITTSGTPVQDLRFRANDLLADAKLAAASQLRAIRFERKPETPPRFRGHGASMGPIRLTDAQLTAVFDAARPLAVRDRDAFLLDLAAALQGQELGDGTVFRLIREVQRRHFDPPELNAHAVPHRRMRAR